MRVLIIILLCVFAASCSPKFIPVQNSRFSYFKKESLANRQIDVELYAGDSIKITTNVGHHDRICIGSIERIKGNTYKVKYFDSRDSSSSNIGDHILRFNIKNETLVYRKLYVKFSGVKIKRVS